MKELAVSSRIIQSVHFSQEDGQLRICFRNGKVRLFTGVPEQAVEAMTEARSPGQHYLDSIRPRYRRIA